MVDVLRKSARIVNVFLTTLNGIRLVMNLESRSEVLIVIVDELPSLTF